VGFDKLSEPLRNPATVRGDDGGMRDRQSKRPSEEDDNCVPIGQAADRRSSRKRREKTKAREVTLEKLCDDEEGEAGCEDDRSEKLRALEFAQSRQILPAEARGWRGRSFFERCHLT
jgi:hypothetical protein